MGQMRNTASGMFTDEDLQMVHDYSLKLLEENGIHIDNERALELFGHHGFKVDGGQIYMTGKQVEEAISVRGYKTTIKIRTCSKFCIDIS